MCNPLILHCNVLQEKDRLASKAHNAQSKLNELKELTETMKEENEKLASSWKTLSGVNKILKIMCNLWIDFCLTSFKNTIHTFVAFCRKLK